MRCEGKPLFSIIVPAYNVEPYLIECVRSVAEQEGPRDWECLVVDDGATDQSGAVADALAAVIPGVIALHRPNGGLSAARNTGLAAASGAWILFLDGDDRMAPGLLAALRPLLAQQPDFDWFVGRYLSLLPNGALEAHRGLAFCAGPCAGTYAERLDRLYAAGHWSVWKYCLRRSLLQQAGLEFWEEVRWAEDVGFDLMLLAKTEKIFFADVLFTHYRENRSGSLLNDTRNLPRRFEALAATLRRLEAMQADSTLDREAFQAARTALADVFWPQARTAAVRDAAVRRACLPGLRALRPLYPYGTEVRTRSSWRLFQLLLRALGPRPALWLASRQR